MDSITFNSETKRNDFEQVSGDISMVRKSTYKNDTGTNQDNGIAITLDSKIESGAARTIFQNIFQQVRESDAVMSVGGEVAEAIAKLDAIDKRIEEAKKGLKAAKKEQAKQTRNLPGRIRRVFYQDKEVFQHSEDARKEALKTAKSEITKHEEDLRIAEGERTEFVENASASVQHAIMLRSINRSGFADGVGKDATEVRGATTAACAMVTSDGVAYAGAGDSVVFLVDDKGEVILLNKLHMGKGQVINNCLTPGVGENAQNDDIGYKSFDELEGANSNFNFQNFRVVTATDGVYGKYHSETKIKHHLSSVAKEVDFEALDYAEAFANKATEKLKGTITHNKPDDITVLSVRAPVEEGTSVMLCAFDGVGQGGEASAMVSARAAEVTEKVVGAYEEAREVQNAVSHVTEGGSNAGLPRQGLNNGRESSF